MARGWEKFTALLVTIAMLAGTTGAGATAFADETVTDGGNVAAEPQRASRNRHNNPMLKTQSDRTLPTLPGKMLPDSPQRTMTTRNALWTTANRIGHRTNKRNRNCSRNRNRNNRRRRCRNSGSRAIRRNSRMSRRSRNGRWLGSRRLRTLTYLPNGAAPTQDGDRNDHAGENRTDAVANGDAGATADDGKTGDADDADNDGNTAEDADDADKNGKNDADKDAASAQNGNDNDKNDAAKDDADADEHIMRDRFTFNRKTVMRAARNVAVPQPDWRSCCASANPIRRWRSERASRQATGLVRAGESLSDQRFTRFCCDEYG